MKQNRAFFKTRRECWKMLTDFFVKSKITASLGITHVPFGSLWRKSAKEVTRKMVTKANICSKSRENGKQRAVGGGTGNISL